MLGSLRASDVWRELVAAPLSAKGVELVGLAVAFVSLRYFIYFFASGTS
jgi:hypothetical protein